MAYLKAFGHKRIFSMSKDELSAYLEQEGAGGKREVPGFIRKKCTVETRNIAGAPCYVLSPKEGVKPCAPVVLFLHGGGFIFEALTAHWIAASKIVRTTGAELWLCVYPLLPRATAYESADVVFAVYREMLATYDANRITVLGDSAGAMLALALGRWLSKLAVKLPQPKQFILLSPVQSYVRDKDLRAQMDALVPLDAMLDTSLLDVMEQLMPVREDRDEFYALPLEGDFFGLPPLYVFSGTHEIFYPLMAGFIARVKASEVPITFYSGEGMCHVWPYVYPAPEGNKALGQIMRIIGE
jgi:acetyl esterase/lipase